MVTGCHTAIEDIVNICLKMLSNTLTYCEIIHKLQKLLEPQPIWT